MSRPSTDDVINQSLARLVNVDTNTLDGFGRLIVYITPLCVSGLLGGGGLFVCMEEKIIRTNMWAVQ